jgi:hypothetical protein
MLQHQGIEDSACPLRIIKRTSLAQMLLICPAVWKDGRIIYATALYRELFVLLHEVAVRIHLKLRLISVTS